MSDLLWLFVPFFLLVLCGWGAVRGLVAPRHGVGGPGRRLPQHRLPGPAFADRLAGCAGRRTGGRHAHHRRAAAELAVPGLGAPGHLGWLVGPVVGAAQGRLAQPAAVVDGAGRGLVGHGLADGAPARRHLAPAGPGRVTGGLVHAGGHPGAGAAEGAAGRWRGARSWARAWPVVCAGLSQTAAAPAAGAGRGRAGARPGLAAVWLRPDHAGDGRCPAVGEQRFDAGRTRGRRHHAGGAPDHVDDGAVVAHAGGLGHLAWRPLIRPTYQTDMPTVMVAT